jgi:hypothetical protein
VKISCFRELARIENYNDLVVIETEVLLKFTLGQPESKGQKKTVQV